MENLSTEFFPLQFYFVTYLIVAVCLVMVVAPSAPILLSLRGSCLLSLSWPFRFHWHISTHSQRVQLKLSKRQLPRETQSLLSSGIQGQRYHWDQQQPLFRTTAAADDGQWTRKITIGYEEQHRRLCLSHAQILARDNPRLLRIVFAMLGG